jgi:hypothetical protein
MKKTGVRLMAGAIGAVLLGVALWWRRHPSACPYGLRFSVGLPHPLITRSRLREILAPEPGWRMLEVGPGTGYYSLPAHVGSSRAASSMSSIYSRGCWIAR